MNKITDAHLLPRHPRIHSTESILPYILRLAEENGYSTPSGIMSHAEIQPANLDSSYNLTQIALVANYPPSGLDEKGYFWNSANRNERSLLAHHVRKQDLSLTSPRLCPECVGEKGFIEAHFDLTVMIGCPVHKKLLVGTCSGCKQKLRWHRPGLLKCECGALICPGTLPLEDAATTDLLDVIRRKVLRIPTKDSYDSKIPVADLSRMSLRSAFFLIAVLGRIQSNRQSPVNIETAKTIVPAAAGLLANWPGNFIRLLEDMTQSHNRGTPILLNEKPLRGLYQSLRYGFKPKDDGAFIRDRLANFCMNALDNNDDDCDAVSAETKASERFMSVNKFAALYHIDPRTAKRALKNDQTVLLPVVTRARSRNYVELGSTSLVPRSSGKIHRIKAAASLLALTGPVLRSLQASNDFEVTHLPKGMPGIHECDVDAFARRLKARAPAPAAEYAVPTSAICLDTIKCGSHHSTAVKAAIVRGILKGIVPVVARRDESVGGLAVPLDLLQQYTKEDRRARIRRRFSERKGRPSGVDDCMTTTDAASSLGCSPLSIPLLIERGALDAERWSRGWWICAASVTKFKQTYTTANAVADSFHTLPYSIMQFCKRSQIPLLEVFLGAHHGTQAFLKSADVPSLSEYLQSLHPKTIKRRDRRMMAAA